jgi:adenosylmethionine-8-amino-7-oxononanoate aminotransferase
MKRRQATVTAERTTVLHSWCMQSQWDAPTVIGGAGARLHLADGRTILDMSSLAECSNLGHQHPRVVAAIRSQAERLCFVTSAWGSHQRALIAIRSAITALVTPKRCISWLNCQAITRVIASA